MSAFQNSLIYKTNPGKYHQILVLSQKMVNNSFQNMWLMAEPNGPLKYFKKSFRGLGTFEGYLKAPYIKLQPIPAPDTPLLYYHMRLSGGTLKLYISEDPEDDTQKTWDMTNWELVFPVNIGRQELKKGDPGYSETAQKMGLDEGSIFTLARLFVEASTTTKIDIAKSSFGSTDWNNETPQTRINLNTFITQWLQWAAENGTSIIGVAAQVSPGDTIPSTFPPTTLDRTAYPWKDPSNPSSGGTNDNDKNALTYLMMTGFAEAPIPPGIEYSGTFVEEGGAFCMNATLFWSSWLLPLFQRLNRGLEFIAEEPYLEAYNGPDPAWAFTAGPRWDIGNNPGYSSADNSYYAWQSAGGLTDGYKWQGGQIQKSKYCRNYNRGADETIVQTSQSYSNIKHTVGGQKISLSGGNTFVYSVTFNWDGQRKRTSTATITSTWIMDFAVGAVNDGGLQISYVNPGSDAVTTNVSVVDGGFGWDSGSFSDIANSIGSNIKGQIVWAVQSVQNSLLYSLAHQEKLFLPAGGVFLMRDAKFNLRGDLLTELTYNGADGPTFARADIVNNSAFHQALPARGGPTVEAVLKKLGLSAPASGIQARSLQVPEQQHIQYHGVPKEA